MLVSTLLKLFISVSAVSSLKLEDLPSKPKDGNLWVVLAAGSYGWSNYRHQADVCHAYQIVKSHGIPDERIIVFMYDDIADNPLNPTKGVIVNHPNGTNVYPGVPKDYTGVYLQANLFLEVLEGKKMSVGSGKTLNSTEKDHVFVYFADHGAKGLVVFGRDLLKAHDLQATIKKMHAARKFAKLVFYLEACESGSMFQGLLNPNMNVYATTASNATTSSFACYFDPIRRVFLGDVYSVKWMEDSDLENIEVETLEQQYKRVKRETNTSQVCQFGDKKLSSLSVGEFQGRKKAESFAPPVPPSWLSCGKTAVSSPQVPLATQENIIKFSQDPAEIETAREKIEEIKTERKAIEDKTEDILRTVYKDVDNEDLIQHMLTDNIVLTEFDCYYTIVDQFHEKCFNLGSSDYALRMLNVFVNLCERGVESQAVVEAIKVNCADPSAVAGPTMRVWSFVNIAYNYATAVFQ